MSPGTNAVKNTEASNDKLENTGLIYVSDSYIKSEVYLELNFAWVCGLTYNIFGWKFPVNSPRNAEKGVQCILVNTIICTNRSLFTATWDSWY